MFSFVHFESMDVEKIYYFIDNTVFCLPFGMPHGPFVRVLSKKSKSYIRAGGYVNATCALANEMQLMTNTISANEKRLMSFD